MFISKKIFLLLAILVGSVALQYLLSRSKSKWLGLILPSISILISLVALLNMNYYMAVKNVLLQSTLVLTIFNIPTIVYVAIYVAGRDAVRKKLSAKEKMNIQDLD
ncbi:hypothetical protein JR334_06380 [Clostridia bacterium]|nr:hypothetical protein JR334_06380 [Clostridia bacterium]